MNLTGQRGEVQCFFNVIFTNDINDNNINNTFRLSPCFAPFTPVCLLWVRKCGSQATVLFRVPVEQGDYLLKRKFISNSGDVPGGQWLRICLAMPGIPFNPWLGN